MSSTARSKKHATPVELIQDLYGAFGRGDIPYVVAHLAPDCKWIVAGEGIPISGTYSGPAGANEFFRKLSETEQILRFEPREYFAKGDDVMALGFEEVRVLSTGKVATSNWAMLFRVRDGMVTHFETFYDTAAYLKAHQG